MSFVEGLQIHQKLDELDEEAALPPPPRPSAGAGTPAVTRAEPSAAVAVADDDDDEALIPDADTIRRAAWQPLAAQGRPSDAAVQTSFVMLRLRQQ